MPFFGSLSRIAGRVDGLTGGRVGRRHRRPDEPGSEIWSQLEQRFGANPAAYDPQRLLGQDQLLLLGEVCQLSDECKYRWGVRA